MSMRRYDNRGKKIFGNIDDAFGLNMDHLSIINDADLLEVQGFSPVSHRRHTEEYESEIAVLHNGL